MEDRRRLVFNRWEIPPAVPEPAHGYYLRLIRHQGIESARTFNIFNDVPDERAVPERALSIINMHPIPDEWKQRLKNATPIVDGEIVRIADQVFSCAQVSPNPRKWCPACIDEGGYHRTWWDVLAIRRCPLHDLAYQTSDDHGNPVPWRWTNFSTSRYGRSLGSHGHPASRPPSFGLYALGRMGFVEPTPSSILDAVELRDAIDFCEMLGKLLGNEHRMDVPDIQDGDIDRGYLLLEAGLLAVTAAVGVWLEKNYPGDLARASMHEAVGWLSRKISAIRDPSVQQMFRKVLKGARGKTGAAAAGLENVPDQLLDHVGPLAVAKKLNMSPRGVVAIAEELGLINRARLRESIPADSTAAIRAFADALLAPKQAAALLGVHCDALRHLTNAGYLKVFSGTVTGRRLGTRFDRKRIDAVLARIDGLPTTGAIDYGVTFDIYRKREKLVPGALAVDVLQGRVAIAGLRSNAVGFKRVVVQTDAFRRGRPFGKPEGWINIAEAQAITNLSFVSVSSLLEQGLLGEVDRKPFLVLLRDDQVRDFASRHAKVSDFSPGLGLHATKVFRTLVSAGVEFVLSGNHKGRRTESVVRRGDVMRVFKAECDPSAIHDPEFVRLWERIWRRGAEMKTGIYLPNRLPAAGQRAWQVSGMLSAVFKYDGKRRQLTIAIKRYGAEYRHIVLGIDATDREVTELFAGIAVDIDLAIEFNRQRKRQMAKSGVAPKARRKPSTSAVQDT